MESKRGEEVGNLEYWQTHRKTLGELSLGRSDETVSFNNNGKLITIYPLYYRPSKKYERHPAEVYLNENCSLFIPP